MAVERRLRRAHRRRGARGDLLGGEPLARRPRMVGLEAGPGHPGLHAARAPAPALRARDARRRSAQGSGLWPHSPPMPRGPSISAPSNTSPPPQPVPRMTPNTERAPAPAPSTASDRAKQLASLASRTGRPSCASRSRRNGWPLSQVELAFCTSPLAGDIEPGMPMPTLPRPPARCLEHAHHLGRWRAMVAA